MNITKGVSEEDFEKLREKLEFFYNNKTVVHISINDGRLRVNNSESIITGVYNHFVTLTTQLKNYNQTFTIKMIDFLIGKATIKEFDFDLSV